VLQQLAKYQIDETKAQNLLKNLSGGQKRLVELVKIAHANADLALIDEPTNHMDYKAKESFVKWLQDVSGLTVVVITHDRDVLKVVDRIIDIRESKAFSYKGNYDSFLKQNSTSTVSAIQSYEVAQSTIENIKKQIIYARRMKAGASTAGGKKNPFIVMEERLTKELAKLEKANPKPNFWIDRESVSQMHSKTVAKYDKYKAKNIRIGTSQTASSGAQLPIINISYLTLGYTEPLFNNISFQLPEGGRLRLHGRNGAGKTTLIKSIICTANGDNNFAKIYSGTIEVRPKLKIGMYEQEIADKYLDLPLESAIEKLYLDQNLPISNQRINQLMSDYLFDPIGDGKIPLNQLSGGQKARFQLISMLSNNPQLLILDEPTNHLDLPSIEELENALHRYKGAIIFVSHDGYFVNGFEHDTIAIGS
jgi:ATPase subunit of ABC transporter with duplicated ATPase domains